MSADDQHCRELRPDLRPVGGGLALHLDRLTFLLKVQDLVPECLEDLYRRAIDRGNQDEVLADWSEEWNLVDDWIMEVARDTYELYANPVKHRAKREQYLRIYQLNKELIDRGEVSMRPPPYGSDEVEPPAGGLRWAGLKVELRDLTLQAIRDFPLLRTPAEPFIFTGYDPEIDNEASSDARLWAAWEDYKKARQEQARQHGAIDSVRRRARSSDDPHLHFTWLVRWQVKGETHLEIAGNPAEGSEPVSEKSVQRAVQKLAARIGITRRSQL